MPRLRSVDVTSRVDVSVTVKIGGIEESLKIGNGPSLPNWIAGDNPSGGNGAVIDALKDDDVAEAVFMDDDEFEGVAKSA